MRLVWLGLVLLFIACAPVTQPQTDTTPEVSTMKLSSPAFQHNGKIPAKYTCQREDINPPLVA